MTDIAQRRSLPVPITGTFAGLFGTAVAAAGASWLASGALLRPQRNSGPLPGELHSLELLRDGPGLPLTLTDASSPLGLSPTAVARVHVSGGFAEHPGTWGLRWDGGCGLVDGPVLKPLADGTSERLLHVLAGTAPEPPPSGVLSVGWDAYVWGPRHPLPGAVACTVDGPLGALDAISVPAQTVDGPVQGLVLHVHGRSAVPAQAMRLLRTCAAAGWDGLAVSYRNSDGAPATGRYALGGTEWEDVHAAVAYALMRGHRRIVLAGCSMGGAIQLSFLQRSTLAGAVIGVVLDCPVLDWPRVLRSVSRNMRAGKALNLLTPFVLQVAALRGAGGARLRLADSVATLDVPTLILHGDADPVTPAEVSIEAAHARPETITTKLLPSAIHATAWNCAPDDYDRAVLEHLAALATAPV